MVKIKYVQNGFCQKKMQVFWKYTMIFFKHYKPFSIHDGEN